MPGSNAQAKGRRLGIFKPPVEKPQNVREKERGKKVWIEILGRPVPAISTEDGIRAMKGEQVINPEAVRRNLASKFGDDLGVVQAAMQRLAKAYKPRELAYAAYSLYERFRPSVPEGAKGWNATGNLDLGIIERLAKRQTSDFQ